MLDRQNFLNKLAEIGLEPTSEQLEKCDLYAAKLAQWNARIKLIGPATKDHIYTRHILDSLQFLNHVPRGTIVDVGSGGGMPGLLWAIFLNQPITLCERIGKKAAFLKTMVRELDLSGHCDVMSGDILEENRSFDIITSRAVTSISDFLDLTQHCLSKDGEYLLMKGGRYQEEIEEALKRWSFEVELHQSLTEDNAKLVVLSDVQKR